VTAKLRGVDGNFSREERNSKACETDAQLRQLRFMRRVVPGRRRRGRPERARLWSRAKAGLLALRPVSRQPLRHHRAMVLSVPAAARRQAGLQVADRKREEQGYEQAGTKNRGGGPAQVDGCSAPVRPRSTTLRKSRLDRHAHHLFRGQQSGINGFGFAGAAPGQQYLRADNLHSWITKAVGRIAGDHLQGF